MMVGLLGWAKYTPTCWRSRGQRPLLFCFSFFVGIVFTIVCCVVERIFTMIIRIRHEASSEDRTHLLMLVSRVTGSSRPVTATKIDGQEVIVLDGSQIDEQARSLLSRHGAVEQITTVKTPYKLVSRAFKPQGSSIVVGDALGGEPVILSHAARADRLPIVIAGPCSVEGKEQILAVAQAIKAAGGRILRGGAFKPRTSPYQFQGLGIEGLEMLAEARNATGLPIITEVMEPELVGTVAQYADILQIGSRNMQNYPLLRAAGRDALKRPVMLKRGLAATIEEWLLAAEYIMASGNPNVILCERGIRSFDTQTRNVLDLTCVPLLHELTHLPILVDPSHATGRRELVPTMSRAAIAAGADGLILEAHLDPDKALSDGRQTITIEQLRSIVRDADIIARMMAQEQAYTERVA
jgi:3-deoxy-7-phosphoheptulonate synthase